MKLKGNVVHAGNKKPDQNLFSNRVFLQARYANNNALFHNAHSDRETADH